MLINAAEAAMGISDFDRAARYLEEGLDLAKRVDDLSGLAGVLSGKGMIALKTGDVVAAKRWSTESLRVHQEHFPERRYAVQALEERAWVEAVAEQPERIAVLLGAASRERERMGVPIPRSVQLEYDRYVPMAQSMIGAVIWDRAWQRGRELSLVESIAFALADEE